MSEHTSRASRPIAVAFDLDGLLVNSEDIYEELVQLLLSRRGKVMDDTLRQKMMGQPHHPALRVMIEHCGLSDALEDLSHESSALFWELAANRLRAMPGARGLLERLAERGIPRCVATSGTRPYALRVLPTIGLAEYFDTVVTSDDVQHGKPAPDIYLLAAERMGVPAGAMLALEDSANGIRAAAAAGAVAVAVPTRHSASHDFQLAVLRVESLEDARIGALLGL